MYPFSCKNLKCENKNRKAGSTSNLNSTVVQSAASTTQVELFFFLIVIGNFSTGTMCKDLPTITMVL